jgi:pimeloyl-ACP methyl ester carboxylesterase
MTNQNTQHATRNIQWVFVHGAGGSSAFWDLVRPAFPGAWCPDLPGHAAGRPRRANEPAPPDEPGRASIEEYADWLMAQVAAQGWPAVALVGHSMGGAIAQVVGLRRPPWLRALVLSGTGARLRVAPEFLELLERDPDAAVDWVIERNFATPPNGYRREGIRRQLARIPPAVRLADYRACNAFNVMAQVANRELHAPALVLCGAEDRQTPPKYSTYLAEHIRGAILAYVPDAGHFAPVEQPAAWAATVWQMWNLAMESEPEAESGAATGEPA